jgi:hypothetical protein
MQDIVMSAFSLFFMQNESFLAYQRGLEEGQRTSNCQTLFGIENIPTDNHIRSMLDPVNPVELQPCYDHVLALLREHGGLQSFQRLGGRILLALDGSEYFCSQRLGCPNCLTRKRSNGKVERYHTMLAATIVAPGHNMAVPLMPEFIAPQDGHAKQDCERVAAKRWLATHGDRLAVLRPVYLGDALFACQPLAQAILETKADFLFVCKEEGHKALYDFIKGASLKEYSNIERRGGKRLTYRYRWIEDVPLRDGKDALHVNWIGVQILDQTGKVTYSGAFVTSLPVSLANVVELVACARARWKIENESFNVLKNHGYHLEHNFGHGKKYLAMMFAPLNLLAFAIHTVCDCCDELWKAARAAKGPRKRFFQEISTISAYHVFPSWQVFLQAIITCKLPPFLQTQPVT